MAAFLAVVGPFVAALPSAVVGAVVATLPSAVVGAVVASVSGVCVCVTNVV